MNPYEDQSLELRASTRIDKELMVVHRDDRHTMATVIEARLKRTLVRELMEETVKLLGQHANMPGSQFLDFLDFLAQDPEIQRKFAAHVAAKRILDRQGSEIEF